MSYISTQAKLNTKPNDLGINAELRNLLIEVIQILQVVMLPTLGKSNMKKPWLYLAR